MKTRTSALRIVGIGGTSRPASTSELALKAALLNAEKQGAQTLVFDGAFVSSLPLYNPQDSGRNEQQRQFIEAIRGCDGIIVATPGYHGSISGPIKNALDLIEDTARDAHRPYLDGRAFGCIVTAHGWQASTTALVSLRMVAHALRAWPTPYGASLNTAMPLFGSDGAPAEEQTLRQLHTVAKQVVDFANWCDG